MFNLLFGGANGGHISSAEAKKRMEEDKNIILLDVRTPAEYREVHIPGSKLVPVDSIQNSIGRVAPNKDTEIIVYCQSGMRAGTAAAQLKHMGYTNVKNLGGIIRWEFETVSGQ